jgi:hypothetical protein
MHKLGIIQVVLCAGEVAGPHGHERDAADSRAQAAPQAPARQGVLPSRRRKVSCFREHFRQSERFRVENKVFVPVLSTFVNYICKLSSDKNLNVFFFTYFCLSTQGMHL